MSESHWSIFGTHVPKPWRAPEQPISWWELLWAFVMVPVVWVFFAIYLIAVGTVIYGPVAGMLDWTVLAAAAVLAVFVLLARSNWRAFARDSHRRNVWSFGAFGQAVTLVLAWVLILLICVPADLITFSLWRRRWHDD